MNIPVPLMLCNGRRLKVATIEIYVRWDVGVIMPCILGRVKDGKLEIVAGAN